MFTMKKLLALSLTCIMFSISTSLAFEENSCSDVMLEGVLEEKVEFKKEFCENSFCFVDALSLPSKKEFTFCADYMSGPWVGYTMESGQKLLIKYQVYRFWHPDLEECIYSNRLVSSKILEETK